MQLCFNCKQPAELLHTVDILMDAKNIYHAQVCKTCKDSIQNQIQFLSANEQPLTEEVKVVTAEQLEQILQGQLDPRDLVDTTGPCTCGHTIEDFQNTGMLGCPRCYTHFGHQIDAVTTMYQGATEHKGRRPPGLLPKIEKLKVLKLLLAKAKEVENYERAKEIQAEIEALQGEQNA